MNIKGYLRPNGDVGIRNHVAVIPSVFCANTVAQKIAGSADGAVALTHGAGCAQVGADLEQTAKVLSSLGTHPNVGAVLVVGLGCERFTPAELFSNIEKSGKPVEKLVIQEEGGSRRAIRKGVEMCRKLLALIENDLPEEVPVSSIILGLECGGTDAASGIAANPALGYVSDWLIDQGGAAIFSEINELLGTEHILSARAENEEVAHQIQQVIKNTESRLIDATRDACYQHRGALISTGNFDGGVTTVVEKALGNICKTGSKKISGTLQYGERPLSSGLYLMDTPSHDGESTTALVAGGAQVVLFTTGRGTPTGFPIAPVIKVTGNPTTYKNMIDDIDFDASPIISSGKSLKIIGQGLVNELQDVLMGKLTKAEINEDHSLMVLNRVK